MKIDLNLVKTQSFCVELPLNNDIVEEFYAWLPESLDKAVASRKNEFLSGRYCTFKASQALGVNLEKLAIGKSREPLWPKQLVGSISHCKAFAISAVALKSEIKSIGIDVEMIIKDSRHHLIERMVARAEDLIFFKEIPPSKKSLVYTILFSAKESLYKVLFPLCGCYFDFKEARIVALDLEENTFSLELISNKEKMKPFLGVYSGSLKILNDSVISTIQII